VPRLTEVSRRPRHPPEGQISEKTAPFAGEGDKGCATQSPDFARRISHPPPKALTSRGGSATRPPCAETRAKDAAPSPNTGEQSNSRKGVPPAHSLLTAPSRFSSGSLPTRSFTPQESLQRGA